MDGGIHPARGFSHASSVSERTPVETHISARHPTKIRNSIRFLSTPGVGAFLDKLVTPKKA
jgi:hypothetical protein